MVFTTSPSFDERNFNLTHFCKFIYMLVPQFSTSLQNFRKFAAIINDFRGIGIHFPYGKLMNAFEDITDLWLDKYWSIRKTFQINLAILVNQSHTCKYELIISRLLPHHNNVRTTTVVVVVVHTPHSFPKNDRTRTVSSHLNVLFKWWLTQKKFQKKIKKNFFLNFFLNLLKNFGG